VTKFVLDCSVSAAWCFGDQRNSYVDSVLESFAKGYEALVPSIWILETINLLSAYDARYIETALRYGIPLATQDSSLRTACKRSGVPVFRPDG
jgi:hypothetical protein